MVITWLLVIRQKKSSSPLKNLIKKPEEIVLGVTILHIDFEVLYIARGGNLIKAESFTIASFILSSSFFGCLDSIFINILNL